MTKVSLKKNIILNIIKQTLSVAFPLITFPYVSRILLEENYGKYSFSLSVVSYFALIAAVGVRPYAIREGARLRENKKKLEQFACEVFSVNMITTVFSYALLLILFAFWGKLRDYALLIGIHSISIVFTTLGVDWVNSVFEDFEYMTKRYIIVKVLSLIAVFCFVKKREDYFTYALIVALSDVLANIMNIVYVRKYVRIHWRLRCQFRKHIVPALVLFANTLAITLYANCAITLLGIFIDDAAVGVYSFSSKIYQISKNLMNAFIIVTVPRLSVYAGNGNTEAYNRLLQRIRETLVFVMLPFVCIVFMLSREIIFLLGGESYLAGESVLQMLSIALVPATLSSLFFDGILIVNRKEKYCLIATIAGTCVNVLLNLFLIPVMGIQGAALSTVISEIISCSLALYFANGYYDVSKKEKWAHISVLVGCVGVYFCCILARKLQGPIILSIGLSCILSCAVYVLLERVLRHPLMDDIMGMISKQLKGSCSK